MGNEVIVEQLGRLSDRMEARFDHVEILLVHHQELVVGWINTNLIHPTGDERHRALNAPGWPSQANSNQPDRDCLGIYTARLQPTGETS